MRVTREIFSFPSSYLYIRASFSRSPISRRSTMQKRHRLVQAERVRHFAYGFGFSPLSLSLALSLSLSLFFTSFTRV